MPKKPAKKPKRKPAKKRQPREDQNQIAYRVMQEVIRRTEETPKS